MRLSNRIGSRPGFRTDRVERLVALARAALAWERLWPALWPASGIIGLYAAAGLLNFFAHIPTWLHVLLLTAMLVSAGALLHDAILAIHWPTWGEGARRLERDSVLAHRPISERDDVLAAGKGDGWAEALWRAHVRRLLASIRNLRLGLPSPGLSEKDPRALRFVVLLVVVAGFVFAGDDWGRRLSDAFLPGYEAFGPSAMLDAWINPPAYTGQAPIYLRRGDNGTEVSAPAGSKIVLRVSGAEGRPHLRGGASSFKGQSGAYAADDTLTRSGDYSVVADGRTLGSWHIDALADTPPMIAFSAPPARTAHNAVKFAFTAADDYGVVKARAIIVPLDGARRKAVVVDLPIDNPIAKAVQQTAYRDLTENPYAGAKVRVTLEAIDGAGQVGRSRPATFVLPERVFTNPLARALVEQRRNLAIGDVAAIPNVLRTLDALTIAPDLFYSDKKGIYTAIRGAFWGLRTARVREDVAHVQSLLWQTALALEEGGLAAAAEQLRAIQQMLSEALQSGAPQDKIDQLLEQYKQALTRYLQLMAQNAQPGNGPVPPDAKVLSEKDLQDLLNAIQQLAQTGARGQAAQALAMLQSLLENLQMNAGAGGGQQSPEDKAKSDAVQQLGDLMGKERELLDKTYREREDSGDPKDGGGKGLAQQQGKLKDELNQIMKGLGGQKVAPPKSLGEAGRSMGEAQGELGNQDFDSAGDAQKEALDDLRKGAGELAKSMMNNGQPGSSGANEDPFGRQQGARGALGGGNLKIPDKSTMERAREILQELRKRAAERGRPKEELDYIDRLLKQF
jgi:uncharacterized protein (TIGR02302 family)